MSAVERWNALAAGWLDWLAGAAVASALALAVAGGLWTLLRRRASAHLGHLLFLVPLVPLVLPPVGALRLTVPAEAPGAAWLARLPRVAAPAPRADAAPSPASTVSTAPTAPRRATADPALRVVAPDDVRPTATAWLALAWALVVAALAVAFVRVQRRTHRTVRGATRLGAEDAARVRALLGRLQREAGVRRDVRLVESPEVGSPAVWGLRRPTVVLPPGLLRRLDDDQLRWVLLHELAHHARRDLFVAGVQRAVQVLWFFHPLVWWINRVVEELRECACDEAALARCPDPPRRRCAEALLEVVAGRLPRPTAPLALQTLHDETSTMKKRILRLIDPARTAQRGLSPAGIPLLLALAGASLASVHVTRATQDPRDRPRVSARVEEAQAAEEAVVDLEAAREAVRRGLAYLLAYQREDGHWPQGPTTDEDAGEFNTVGVTGFAVLALLEAEASDPHPKQREALAGALQFLEWAHDEETGLFGPAKGHCYMASHAVATLAWLRAHAGEPAATWRPLAEQAVHAILRARNPYAGWRFDRFPVGDNDSVSTSLMLVALAAARDAAIEVPARDTNEALSYLDQLTDARGRTGYDTPGGNPARLAGRADFPAEYSEMCTGITMVARLDWGQDPRRSDALRRGAHVVSDQAPVWDRARGTIDYYHWLFGSDALSRLGGYEFEHWRDALLRALLPNQQEDGSWPAVDAWSGDGTTVHATVVNVLALQYALR